MVAVPTFTPFTLPELDTVATFLFELFQVTLLSAKSEGVMVAFKVNVLPFSIVASVLLSSTLASTISTILLKFFHGFTSL